MVASFEGGLISSKRGSHDLPEAVLGVLRQGFHLPFLLMMSLCHFVFTAQDDMAQRS